MSSAAVNRRCMVSFPLWCLPATTVAVFLIKRTLLSVVKITINFLFKSHSWLFQLRKREMLGRIPYFRSVAGGLRLQLSISPTHKTTVRSIGYPSREEPLCAVLQVDCFPSSMEWVYTRKKADTWTSRARTSLTGGGIYLIMKTCLLWSLHPLLFSELMFSQLMYWVNFNGVLLLIMKPIILVKYLNCNERHMWSGMVSK